MRSQTSRIASRFAHALDGLRGLLPAGALSNAGLYGSGQSYELLLLRMRGHGLPEVRHYGEMMLEELRKVIPSFLTRVDRPDRGGAWSTYLATQRDAMQDLVAQLWPEEMGEQAPSVALVDFDPAGEEKVLAAMCYPFSGCSEAELARRVAALSAEERGRIMATYVGERTNRRHKPGRAFERTDYRFDIVADYGAFRDLQRHRMLTTEWQPLSTRLGYVVPDIIEQAGLGDRYRASLERSGDLAEALSDHFDEQASYAIALAFNVRFVLQLNAREAMHLIELRSSPQGHPSYRVIAQEMHRLIAEVAGHRDLAAAMSFVDHSEVDLGRLEAEERQARRASRPDGGHSLGSIESNP